MPSIIILSNYLKFLPLYVNILSKRRKVWMMATVIPTLFLLKFFASLIAVSECKMAKTLVKNNKIFAKVPGDGKWKTLLRKLRTFCAVYRQMHKRQFLPSLNCSFMRCLIPFRKKLTNIAYYPFLACD